MAIVEPEAPKSTQSVAGNVASPNTAQPPSAARAASSRTPKVPRPFRVEAQVQERPDPASPRSREAVASPEPEAIEPEIVELESIDVSVVSIREPSEQLEPRGAVCDTEPAVIVPTIVPALRAPPSASAPAPVGAPRPEVSTAPSPSVLPVRTFEPAPHTMRMAEAPRPTGLRTQGPKAPVRPELVASSSTERGASIASSPSPQSTTAPLGPMALKPEGSARSPLRTPSPMAIVGGSSLRPQSMGRPSSPSSPGVALAPPRVASPSSPFEPRSSAGPKPFSRSAGGPPASYERAFRPWSSPAIVPEDEGLASAPVTFRVYTPEDLVRGRRPVRSLPVLDAEPKKPNAVVRVGLGLLGLLVVSSTVAAVVAVSTEDPKGPEGSSASTAEVPPHPGLGLDAPPAPPPPPPITIGDPIDPAPAPTAAAPPRPRPRAAAIAPPPPPAPANLHGIAPPPNPYGK